MDLDTLIKKALEAKQKHGNIKVRVGGTEGRSALDTSIYTCEIADEFNDVDNEIEEQVFMIWDE